ncbi:MAG: hypothetical protein M2R45_02215 [Verrucomicrobia subdivision 3 bacterium]|nr:hypothetical protein [Limisphaerales bacterium]
MWKGLQSLIPLKAQQAATVQDDPQVDPTCAYSNRRTE